MRSKRVYAWAIHWHLQRFIVDLHIVGMVIATRARMIEGRI